LGNVGWVGWRKIEAIFPLTAETWVWRVEILSSLLGKKHFSPPRGGVDNNRIDVNFFESFSNPLSKGGC